jgi:hypothetical protein
MTVYTVIGYERTTRMMQVEADSEEEAIIKAKAGDYFDVDTEPGPCIFTPKWRVERI